MSNVTSLTKLRQAEEAWGRIVGFEKTAAKVKSRTSLELVAILVKKGLKIRLLQDRGGPGREHVVTWMEIERADFCPLRTATHVLLTRAGLTAERTEQVLR